MTSAPGRAPVVAAADAAMAIGGRTIWSGLTATIHAGEFVAVVGPNGAGKSTLLKAILGALPLAGGRLEVLGRQPGEANTSIGYLPQRRVFDAGLRVRGIDVVRLGWDGHRWGLPLPGRRGSRDEGAARVAQALEMVGATAYAHRPVGQVSGGEQQRLLIAQALIQQPQLLLLDEPLDSLDLPNQASVAGLVTDIARTGVAVIMVTHDVNPILASLDRVIYLGAGRTLCGAPDDVITSETLSALFDTGIEVLRSRDGRLVVVGQPEPPAVHADRHGH